MVGFAYHKFGKMFSPDSLLINRGSQISTNLAVFGTGGGSCILLVFLIFLSMKGSRWRPGQCILLPVLSRVIGGGDSGVILRYVLPL